MTIVDALPLLGFVGSIGGAGAVMKYVGNRNTRDLEKHIDEDKKTHTMMTETVTGARLDIARLETKIDLLLKREGL